MSELSPSDSDLGVRLVLAHDVGRPGDELRYSLINEGTVPLLTGVSYSLDIRGGSGWSRLPVGPFRGVGLGVAPGARRDFTVQIPHTAAPGDYRMRKRIFIGTPRREDLPYLPEAARRLPIELAIEFRVATI